MNDFCNEDFGGKAKGQSMSMDWKNSYFMLVFLYSLAGVGSSTPQLSFSPSHCPLCLTGILSCSCNLDSSFLLFPWDVTLTIEAMVQNLIFCCLDTFRSCIRGMFLFRRCSLSIFVDSWYSGLHYSLFFFFFWDLKWILTYRYIFLLCILNGHCRYYSKEEIQMANRHGKNYSSSLEIREIQIKATLKVQLPPLRVAHIQETISNTCCRGCWGEGMVIYSCWDCRLV